MKQRLKPYNKRKLFKMKKGGAKYSLRSEESKFRNSGFPEEKTANTITNFIDLLFRSREIRPYKSPNIRSNIKQENKEITKEN